MSATPQTVAQEGSHPTHQTVLERPQLDKGLLAFLTSGDAFPGENGSVETITTHGAVVFLGPSTVLKVKLPVLYDYMDFSKLKSRREACFRELEINRVTAPDIYLGVEAICRSPDGTFRIGGSGRIVEYGVRMRRFQESGLLSRVAETGDFTFDLSERLAEAIVNYHRERPRAETADGAARVQELVDELGRELVHLPSCSAEHGYRKLVDALEKRLSRTARYLDRRAEAGLVKRCHGDLHLRNIVIYEGEPTPFDALEFDERLATTDVLYDLSFLLMDMMHSGLTRQANALFNRYLYLGWSLFEEYGFAVLPLFLSLRAAIRCMVEHQSSASDRTQFGTHELDAEFYYDEALKFLSAEPPVLIAVGGYSGTGKSVLARSLAPSVGPAPGAFVVRSDMERKKMLGAEEDERLPGEAYNQLSTRHVYERLFDKARIALAQGHSVILDASFAADEHRQTLARLARKVGLKVHFFWLTAPPKTLLERVSNRQGDASDADTSVVEMQLTRNSGFAKTAPAGWSAIDASGVKAETERYAKHILLAGEQFEKTSAYASFHHA